MNISQKKMLIYQRKAVFYELLMDKLKQWRVAEYLQRAQNQFNCPEGKPLGYQAKWNPSRKPSMKVPRSRSYPSTRARSTVMAVALWMPRAMTPQA